LLTVKFTYDKIDRANSHDEFSEEIAGAESTGSEHSSLTVRAYSVSEGQARNESRSRV